MFEEQKIIYIKYIWEILRGYKNTKNNYNCFNCKYRKIDKILKASVCSESKYNCENNNSLYHRTYKHKICSKYIRKDSRNGI